VAAWFYLTDEPSKAAWLPEPQRRWLSQTMATEKKERVTRGHGSALASLRSGKVWLLCAIYFMNTLVTYGVFLWLPRILKEAAGPGVSVGMLTALPFVVALAGMVLVGRHSDRTGERQWHVAACALTAAAGLMVAVAFKDSVAMLVVGFTLSQLGQRSLLSVFWAIPPIFLGGSAAAAGIALINSIGNLGGAVGPAIMGWLRGVTGDYAAGLLVLATALVIEAILVASMRLPPRAAPASTGAAAARPAPAR
jgi:ACS family tartrate transporter-like MFS transporter